LLRAYAPYRRYGTAQGPIEAPAFDLDLSAIEKAIGPKTRLVIVNTPHNPTGRIYDRDTLKALSNLLDRASAKFGRRIFSAV